MCDPWNIRAGEVLRYLPRKEAEEIGLLPAAGPADWWLLDDETLVIMRFDESGNWTGSSLDTGPASVSRARNWRELAIAHTRPAVRSAA